MNGHPAVPQKLTEEQQAAIATLTEAPQYAGESKLKIFFKIPWRQKAAYFKTHFLVPTIGAICVVALVTFMLFRFLVPSPKPALYVAVLEDALPITSAQTLQDSYSERLGDDVTVDDYFDMSDDGLSKLQTMISNKEIDVVIAPESVFSELAGYGYFGELSSVLTSSQQQSLGTYAANFNGYNDGDEYDSYDTSGSGKGESLPYGLELADAGGWTALEDANDTALAGVVANTTRESTAQNFLSYLFDGKGK